MKKSQKTYRFGSAKCVFDQQDAKAGKRAPPQPKTCWWLARWFDWSRWVVLLVSYLLQFSLCLVGEVGKCMDLKVFHIWKTHIIMLIITLSLPNVYPSHTNQKSGLQHNTRTQACTKVYDGPTLKTRLLTIKKHPDTRTKCNPVDWWFSKNQRTGSDPSPTILKIHGTSSDT
jgi:hypothetical protein